MSEMVRRYSELTFDLTSICQDGQALEATWLGADVQLEQTSPSQLSKALSIKCKSYNKNQSIGSAKEVTVSHMSLADRI